MTIDNAMNSTSSTEAVVKKSNSRDVDWYHQTLTWLPKTTSDLLYHYSGIPREDIIQHIHKIRDKAWDIFPYPCIGVFRFIEFGAYLSPVYPQVVKRLSAGQTFLDLGCCFGQDIRKLVFDGVPSANLIGVDLHPEFHTLGYELFRDRSTLQAQFIAQSIFDEDFLPEYHGKIDIMYMGAFLHLFNFEQQRVIMRQVMRLMRPEKGSMVFGRHVGAEMGGEIKLNGSWDLFGHSDQTIRGLWSEECGEGWEVQSQLAPFLVDEMMSGNSRPAGQDERIRMMYFSACRV
ncbi:hypothetical protein BJY04DRAFT_215060 [Aspergillus karnatakaensis]|uniref:uncharacterized protein n=1 Tax=Aspergillus karnatakaensis TaxID=1810916 RepID=UPI003CCCF73B